MSDFASLGFKEHGASEDFDGLGFKAHAPAIEPNKTPDDIMAENAKKLDEKGDVVNDHFLDTISLRYGPQIKAKIGQLLAGEGYENDANYLRRRDQAISDLKTGEEKYPLQATQGKVGGFVAPLLATGGGSTVAEGASIASRIGQGALQGARAGAVYGGLSNPGDVEGKVDPLQAKERIENAGTGMAIGGAVGGGLPLVGAGIQSLSTPAKWAAQKVGKIFTPVSEETTARYLENPAIANTAPTTKENSDKIMSLKDAADSKVLSSKEELEAAQKALTETKADTRVGLVTEGTAVDKNLSEAKANFAEKKQKFKESLQSNNLTSMATDVHQAVADLKDKVVQGSKDAYEILGKETGGVVPIQPLVDNLESHIKGMTINGVPRNSSAEQSIQEIRAMQDRLKQMTSKTDGGLSLPQAKQMLQGLDKDLPYGGQPGSFAAPTENAFKELRYGIDQTVKTQSPEYASKMQEVSGQTQLLKKANDLYGTPEKAISNLNNIDSEKGQALHVPMLAQLSKETGKDLSQPVQGYLMNQKILSTPTLFEQALEQIPEAKALRAARAESERISDPAYARETMEKATAPIQSKIDSASAQLDAAKERQGVFKGVTADSISGKQKALSGANSYGAEDRIGKIDQAYGTNFKGAIQARNDLDSFSKDNTRGGRGTLLGGAIGGFVGHLLGHSETGVMVGAGIGGAADKYSGAMFKSALNAGMAVGKVTNATGRALEQAPAAIAESAAKMRALSPQTMVANNPTKGPGKWANDGFQNLLDHAKGDDKETIQNAREKLLSTPAGKKLLISASDMKVGSKAMDRLLEQVKAEATK